MQPRKMIQRFDAFVAGRGLRLDAVVVGGAALNLLGVVTRTTRDCDVLVPELSKEIKEASRTFAAEMRRLGDHLDDEWLNNGPSSLVRDLPSDWNKRLVVVFTGQAIELSCLGREDLLRAKLFALCDRALDLADCIALAPSPEELGSLHRWIEERDANPDWPEHVRATLDDLARKLGHGA